MKELVGRRIYKGKAEGEALVTRQAISFYGGVDPEKGMIVERGHELEGQHITNKILVFPRGKGSTVGSYILYHLSKVGNAPKALILTECEAIVAVGCIIGEIPCVDHIDIQQIHTGTDVRVNATQGIIEVM
ncbi:MAG: DUF126 domain-containing protein [Candidatus Thorarchaeota archaeon]